MGWEGLTKGLETMGHGSYYGFSYESFLKKRTMILVAYIGCCIFPLFVIFFLPITARLCVFFHKSSPLMGKIISFMFDILWSSWISNMFCKTNSTWLGNLSKQRITNCFCQVRHFTIIMNEIKTLEQTLDFKQKTYPLIQPFM